MTKRERLFDGDEYDCLMPTIYDSESSHAHKRKKMKKFIDSEIRRQIKAFSEEIWDASDNEGDIVGMLNLNELKRIIEKALRKRRIKP